jgi:hypothetical protein
MSSHGNPRPTLGKIGTSGDGSITAEVVTVDGSLVRKLPSAGIPVWSGKLTNGPAMAFADAARYVSVSRAMERRSCERGPL